MLINILKRMYMK